MKEGQALPKIEVKTMSWPSFPFRLKKTLNRPRVLYNIICSVGYILLRHIQVWIKGQSYNYQKTKKEKRGNFICQLAIAAAGERSASWFEFYCKEAKETQRRTLKTILKSSRKTKFGQAFQFSTVNSIEEYQQNVPVQDYESLRPYINKHLQGHRNWLVRGRPIVYATTSGTSGTPKYIPVTKKTFLHSHQNVARIWTYYLFKDYPEAFKGKSLNIVSAAIEGQVEDGTPYGSTSGQLTKSMGKISGGIYAIPAYVYEIEDYEARYYCILRISLEQDVTMIHSANPSSIIMLAKKANHFKSEIVEDMRWGTLKSKLNISASIRSQLEKRFSSNPKRANELETFIQNDPDKILRPKNYWPRLAVIGCWTEGNCKTYLRQVEQWFPEVPLRDLGYLATEIRASIPLWDGKSEGALAIHENFFEFVEVDDIDNLHPKYLTIDNVKPGRKYYIYITTKAGLYRYNINDIVEVKGFYHTCPTVVFVQKGKGVTNITGEKISEEQIIQAVGATEKKLNIFTKCFIAYANLEKTCYDLFIEFEPSDYPLLTSRKLDEIASEIEQQLQTINIEYKHKRKSQRLFAMNLIPVVKDSFEQLRLRRVADGVREQQYKMSFLTGINKDISFFEKDPRLISEIHQNAN